nr:hypothetical protein [Rhodococcus sp. (in: high G+C Gram-positive bacteria)]
MSFVAAVIVVCEIGFWALIAIGLVVRYPLKRRREAGWILAAVPVLDVVLIAAVAVDLSQGTPVGSIHHLAAYYLGFSIGFGPALIRWVDVRVAHRFAGGPAPVKLTKDSQEYRRYLWDDWFRAVAACGVAAAVLAGLAFTVASDEQASALLGTIPPLGIILGIWFLAGPAFAPSRTTADR